MKTYKDYEKQYIGTSDIASLILVGYKPGEGAVTEMLHFGKDDSYKAYIVDDNAEIGKHYNKIAEFEHWLKIYDDEGLVRKYNGSKINVYRAAEMGCIIQLSE